MATYTFRCPVHGDFTVQQEMRHTTRSYPCTHGAEVIDAHPEYPALDVTHACMVPSPKVLSGNLHFTYGRKQFHDGPTGDGQTVRETQQEWLSSAKAAGLEPEGVGYRHI